MSETLVMVLVRLCDIDKFKNCVSEAGIEIKAALPADTDWLRGLGEQRFQEARRLMFLKRYVIAFPTKNKAKEFIRANGRKCVGNYNFTGFKMWFNHAEFHEEYMEHVYPSRKKKHISKKELAV